MNLVRPNLHQTFILGQNIGTRNYFKKVSKQTPDFGLINPKPVVNEKKNELSKKALKFSTI